jgi:hypothetical protein
MVDKDRAVKDFEREASWTLNIAFVKDNVQCLICGGEVEEYNDGHQCLLRCKNGHELIMRNVHVNN